MAQKLHLEIEPRFNELDGLGHINNATYLKWFEQARIPLFRIFIPDLDLTKWNLIIARNEVDYLKPVDIGSLVTIESYLSKIGNSSMIVEHELFQNDELAAKGKCVMIHYDYQQKKSIQIATDFRSELNKYLIQSH